MTSNLPPDKAAGFTLLEVIISLVILTFIALGIYQATTQTFRLRQVLSVDGDFYNGIRFSMDILQRDISLIYDQTLILPPKKTPTTTPATPTSGAISGQVQTGNADTPQDLTDKQVAAFNNAGIMTETQYWSAVADKSGLRAGRFQGSANKLSFIAASHIRIYKDAPESEFAKVAYELGPDKADAEVPGTSILFKIESPNVYEDEDRKDKYIVRYPLLHGVKSLKFNFYRKDKDVWLDNWDSTNGDTKGIYPDEIKVTIDVGGPEKLEFDGMYIFRPEVPLHGLDPST